ncbi:hypothetical protein SAMN04488568_10832 [Maricaulis salignorans]|uniref:Uncharacterized protein n=2 Tax=Maricaulis salignorans TaxID=144026 RepID=A0A1G9RZT5_9PROT|nr:hypothetical protein SAMN04488568_10832 [Maricaulis salignorans]
MELRMTRFGRMTWHSSARLVALASWALAIALTGSMGWQAWTAIQETNGAQRYGGSQVDTAMMASQSLTDAQLIAHKNRVAR